MSWLRFRQLLDNLGYFFIPHLVTLDSQVSKEAVSRTFLWSVGGGDDVVSVGNFQNTLTLCRRADALKIIHNNGYNLLTNSTTRFGEFSPLWQNVHTLQQFFES